MKPPAERAKAALDASIGVELAPRLPADPRRLQWTRTDVRRGGPTMHRALGRRPPGGERRAALRQPLRDMGVSAPGQSGAAVAASHARAGDPGPDGGRARSERRELTAREILEVQRAKTGSYTFELPLHLGATLAGASGRCWRSCPRTRARWGSRSRIADDLLGTFGEAAVTGKSNASDLREGKRTLVVARALETASPEDAARLRSQLGRSARTVGELRAILRRQWGGGIRPSGGGPPVR